VHSSHQKEVVETLVSHSVSSADSFDWQRQMRFYWEDDHVQVKQGSGVFEYNYEYLGLNGYIVISPLQERCFLALATAL